MRLWLVNPKIMCRQHLLGEHVECHMLAGTLKKGNNIDGYLNNNLLEPLSILKRHEDLAKEIERRGYNHESPLKLIVFNNLTEEQLNVKINKKVALNELIKRCDRCKQKWRNKK